MIKPFSIRPLPIILARIARRKERLARLVAMRVPQNIINTEQKIIDSLSKEYCSRMARLNLYMGVSPGEKHA